MFSRIQKKIIEYKEIKYLAYHDSLTGLLNRNWLFKNIDNIEKKYVFFIDINNLTEINKQGHTFGDEHIILCVKKMKMSLHNTFDYLVRYAGDEFICFTNKPNALKTNKYYCVGKAKNTKNIKHVINIADNRMLKEKKRIKNLEK